MYCGVEDHHQPQAAGAFEIFLSQTIQFLLAVETLAALGCVHMKSNIPQTGIRQASQQVPAGAYPIGKQGWIESQGAGVADDFHQFRMFAQSGIATGDLHVRARPEFGEGAMEPAKDFLQRNITHLLRVFREVAERAVEIALLRNLHGDAADGLAAAQNLRGNKLRPHPAASFGQQRFSGHGGWIPLCSSAMRLYRSPLSFLTLIVFFALRPALAESGGQGSSFTVIRAAVFASPYSELPHYRVSREQFGSSGDKPGNRVLAAARRTLQSREDLLPFPGGQKLFQANGICFAARWIIDASAAYTGLLSPGTQVPAIVRASVSLDGTKQDDKRAFGLAIKLFPTTDPQQPVHTVNVFVMHSLGGVRSRHVTDLSLDNEPSLGALPPFSKIATALRLQRDFERADKEISGRTQVNFRPITELAAPGNEDRLPAPRWLRLTVAEGTPKIDRDDFREELQLAAYPDETLNYVIAVAAAQEQGKRQAQWENIGRLELYESVVSPACDRELHFAHPALD